MAGSFKLWVRKHSPELLAIGGVTGFAATAVMASHATIKAVNVVNEVKPETKKETVKATWKLYLPSVAMFVASSACIVSSNKIQAKHFANLAASYELAKLGAKEFKDSVVEKIGEKKTKEIEENVNLKKLETTTPPESVDVIPETKNGDTVFMSYYGGRYFKSSREAIEKAFAVLETRLATAAYAPLNELWDLLNLEETQDGDYYGWPNGTKIYDEGNGIIWSTGMMNNDPNKPVSIFRFRDDLIPQEEYFVLG